MNRENVKAVRDHIAALADNKFDMGSWGYEDPTCGTVACIAGWADAIATSRNQNPLLSVEINAERFMDLSPLHASRLFMPIVATDLGWGRKWQRIRSRHAVAVLDHLLETGCVDWSIIGEYDAEREDKIDAELKQRADDAVERSRTLLLNHVENLNINLPPVQELPQPEKMKQGHE